MLSKSVFAQYVPSEQEIKFVHSIGDRLMLVIDTQYDADYNVLWPIIDEFRNTHQITERIDWILDTLILYIEGNILPELC